MLESAALGFGAFVLVFAVLRGVEWAYHHLRHTPDWSPHWGSWLFAALCGLYVFVENLGRS